MVVVGATTLYPMNMLQSYMGLDVSETSLRSRAPACLQVRSFFSSVVLFSIFHRCLKQLIIIKFQNSVLYLKILKNQLLIIVM